MPEPAVQQILGELTSLLPSDGSSTPAPAPGTDQSVVDQVSCQVQTGQPAPGTAVQTASQTSTTIQLIDLLPLPSGGSQASGTPAVNQTEQQTWQLQIGCLFYCTDTQQAQQAQQTIATIQVLLGQPGSSAASTAGAPADTSQVIWQLQIGCIAWCYDATQVQNASSQTTVTVITVVPPAATPPPSTAPPAGTVSSSPQGPVIGQVGAVVSDPSTATPSTAAVSPAPPTPLSPSFTRAGVAIIGRRPNGMVVVPLAPAPAPALTPAAARAVVPTDFLSASDGAPSIAPRAFVRRPARPTAAVAPRRQRSSSSLGPRQTAPLEAVAARPERMPSILIAALGLIAAAVLWGLGGGQRRRRER